MIEGKFGLFSGGDKQIHCNIRAGDDGIPLEDILPQSMRGNGFADAPISAYLNLLYMWLCSEERWQAAQTAILPKLRGAMTDGIAFQPPGLDLIDLRLLDRGFVDYDRFHDLCLLVAPYWDLEPPVGLIVGLIADGMSLDGIEKTLAALYPKGAPNIGIEHKLALLSNRPDVRFVDLFMPPEARIGRGEINIDVQVCMGYALSWIRQNQDMSRIAWQVDMKRLGVLADGKLDFKRAELISDYIWARRDETPSFEKLTLWLKEHDVLESKQLAASLKLVQKNKKLQRKQRKLKRKRR